MMNIARTLALALVAALALAAAAAPCFAQSVALDNLILDNEAGRIMMRFGLHIEGLDTVREELVDGSVLGLVGEALLERKRAAWFNETIGRAEYESVLRFDALAKEFVLEKPGLAQPLRDKDLASVIAKAWGKTALDLGDWASLKRGSEYVLEFRVRLTQLEVPAWLKSALFFWPWDTVPETGYSLDFMY